MNLILHISWLWCFSVFKCSLGQISSAESKKSNRLRLNSPLYSGGEYDFDDELDTEEASIYHQPYNIPYPSQDYRSNTRIKSCATLLEYPHYTRPNVRNSSSTPLCNLLPLETPLPPTPCVFGAPQTPFSSSSTSHRPAAGTHSSPKFYAACDIFHVKS